MSDLQGNSKNEAKRRRISPSATEHAEYKESEELSPPSPASSEERLSLGGEIDLVFKTEPMDDEGAETDAGPSADQKEDTGLDEDMIEELKVEFEDDPLTFGEANVSLTMDEVATHDNNCDVDFSPGCYENLPLIDPLAVTEYFAALPDYDKAEMRALWRQPRELLNDTIGYVQIQREHATCTVKCEVASKTTSNSCCITYDEDNNRIVNTFCECLKLGCSHELAAAIWVCRREGGPGTYWLQPMVTRDPKSMTISAIFGFPKKKIQKKCSFLEDFLKICQENKVFTPAIMRHYHEDDRTKASLHKLMCKFKRNNNLEADGFLEYCKKAITNKDCVKALETMSVDVRQELEYGRITDALLHEVSQAADDVEELVEKITLPGAEEREEVNAGIIQSLEKSMKMSITPCGLIISNKSPIFAASPYGTTPTHVVYIKHLAGDSGDDYTGKTLSAKNYACMQLQMYLAKKKNGCFCAVHKSNRIDIMIVKQNQAMMRNLIWKATEFWKTHIFKAINMENAD